MQQNFEEGLGLLYKKEINVILYVVILKHSLWSAYK